MSSHSPYDDDSIDVKTPNENWPVRKALVNQVAQDEGLTSAPVMGVTNCKSVSDFEFMGMVIQSWSDGVTVSH